MCLLIMLAMPRFLGAAGVPFRGKIVDASGGKPLAARLYIESGDGRWYFARSAASAGSAVQYEKQRPPASVEMHTSLSAHPFIADLPPGDYTVTVERGKEYFTHRQQVQIRDCPVDLTIRLQRWTDMAREGWYSGETHVHRTLAELPAAMLAEDLNVAFPLTYWVTRSGTPPGVGDKNQPPARPEVVKVDASHVYYPVNTEYEIFTVDGKRHETGAVFGLNHRNPLELGVPPVGRVAEQVHGEGGLLELDKHGWPWSMMLVPVMKVDLYELANNHMWRTNFAFTAWGRPPAGYMNIERDSQGFTEKGWIDFTFQNYYALLNCGFRLRPTAGTASGVHPVPLGFGRVYVQLGKEFSYEAWLKGLNEGRSFVTTGPMLMAKMNGAWPGETIHLGADQQRSFTLSIETRSAQPLSKVEILSAGEVISTITPQNRKATAGAYSSSISTKVEAKGSTWIAVRCFEQAPEGRVRFAHTAPFHVQVSGRPLRPLRREVEYLIERVSTEIERNRGVMTEEAIGEYRQALAAYQEIAKSARQD
jgi:hypothetical protein